jgi:hypothetical protein
MDTYDRVLRARLRSALCGRPLKRADGTLTRDGADIGTVGGYLYVKSRGGFTVSLPASWPTSRKGTT